MTRLGIALVTAMMAIPAHADEIVRVAATGSVAEVMDRLEGAVTNAGANVFARVDHGAGAASVDMELGASQLLVFGNPALGTLSQDIVGQVLHHVKTVAAVQATAVVSNIFVYRHVG